MATAATIAVTMKLVTAEFKRGLDQATKDMAGFSKNAKMVGKSLSKMGTVMSATVTAPIVAGFIKITLGAAEAAETMGAVDMVFGDTAETIHKFAQTSADAVGLASTEFKQLATVTGSFLQNLGYDADEAAAQTIILTERASDMAAVFNTDVSTALQAIQSGLKGEMNPLENFGVKMNAAAIEAKALAMGLADAEGELDDNAKAQATLALLMEQTNRVSGTFNKEAEGLSGQMKILKANVRDAADGLGVVLLPAATNIISKVTEFAQKLANLDADTQKVILTIAGLAAAIGPLLGIISKLVVVLPKLKTQFIAVKGAAATLNTAMGGMLGPLGLVAIAIAGVVTALVIFKGKVDENIAALSDAKTAAMEAGEGYEEYKRRLEDAGIETDQTKQKTSEYRATLKTAREDLKRLADEHIISRSKYEELYSKMDVGIITAEEMAEMVYNLEYNMKNMGTETQNAGSDLGYYMGQVVEATSETDLLGGSVRTAAEAAANYYDYVDLATAGTEGLGTAALNLREELDPLGDAFDIAREAMDALGVSLINGTASADEFALASGELTEEGLRLADQSALLKDAVYTLTGAMADGEISTHDLTVALSLLRDAAADGSITIGELHDAIDNLPREVRTKILVEYFISTTGKPPIEGYTPIDILKDIDTPVGGPLAAGGSAMAGIPYLVGEEGPEWFIPNTSGTVLPNGTGLVSSSSGSSGIDEATQALKEYNDELSNTGRIVDKLLTKDLPDIFSAKNLVISSKPIKDLVTSVRDYVISSNPIKDLITSAKNLVITSNPLLNLVTSAKNLVITSNEAQSLYSNSLLKARTETDLYSDSVLKARYDMSLYSDSVLKARSIMSLYSDDPTHGRTYSEPVFSRYGGAEKTDVGGTRNYYLTANYPQESQMSLIERVKVLEALG